MESTALSLGKSVLNGALGYAKSALSEEVALQLGIQRDHAFIRDELEMMLAFLLAAHDEQDKHQLVKTWVKQVRDVAYDAEDTLQDFAVRVGKPSWWRILRKLFDRHHVAKQMKELRAKVEDVSQRNQRYQLIKGSGSKAAASTGQSNMVSATMSGTEEAMRERNNAKVDLIRLIRSKKDDELRVISVWGTNNVGEASIVKRAYDDLKRGNKFECQAWISITHPFNRMESLQNIVRQLFVDSLHEGRKTQEKSSPGAHDLRRMGKMTEADLIGAFKKYVNEKSFLIVLCNLSSNEEWDQIKACFPNNKKGSRLIVCTEKVDVASLCVGKDTEIPEHKQLSTDPALLAFYEKDSQEGTYSMEPGPSSNLDIITDNNGSVSEKRFTRMGTMVSAYMESQLIGRMDEKSEIIKLVLDNSSKEFEVISICGMGGLGKTTLVKYVYQSQELSSMFEKRACVTVKRPFDPNELLNSLATQLTNKEAGGNQEKPGNQPSLSGILEGKKYLVVLDDLSSPAEWDAIHHYFPRTEPGSRIIVTTRIENTAMHCSKKKNHTHKLKILGEKDACDLFTEKVFGKITNLEEHYPELAEVAKLILKKCNGLPLAIVTIGGFLSKQPKTLMEWGKLNDHIGVELEMNQELGAIKDILVKSYDGLPYHLKSCFLYMAIFPEDHNISRRRLVRRWIAEGYSSGVHGKSDKDIADRYFMDLIDRSMILPFRESIGSRNGIDSCQVHDIMREISILKSTEENLVFRMEEGCISSNSMSTTRHLSISRNWQGDKTEFESAVDFSRIRSLTLFGRWKPFFISENMRLLRVLDLEGTSNLVDHHLVQIGMLVHLKYLSLRGCVNIFHLPSSLGNLKQLQTLDIYGTRIVKLPHCIINIRKLQYIRAGKKLDYRPLPTLLQRMCIIALSVFFPLACCFRELQEDQIEIDSQGDSNRRDLCTWCCHVGLPIAMRLANEGAVVVPRGLRKLKTLHTLGIVNIARGGKSILQEIKCLVQLRKLSLTGINKKNCQEFCSLLAALCFLESLSVVVEPGLSGCLDGVSSPPKSLQSLRLEGELVKLPKWIGELQNLVKLKLRWTRLSDIDGSMQILGKLPNLAILRLLEASFEEKGRHRLIFRREAPFPSLMVLEMYYVCGIFMNYYDLDSVEFGEEAAPMLELLHFFGLSNSPTGLFSGLASLRKLKEFGQDNYTYPFEADVQAQLALNPNGPIFIKYPDSESRDVFDFLRDKKY